MSEDFWVERSWAAEPMFYEAPHPPSDTHIPRPYQHAGVEYALARDHCLIGDAPRIGKSCQGILISNAIDARRTLVVCPASLRLNWEREIWRWSTIPNVRTYPTLRASDGISPEAHYQIVSYDLLRNRAILDAIMALRWDHEIIDEAHYIKDPKGNKRIQAICAPDALPSVVERMTLLSGTILPNQPVECYNVFRLLDWDAIDRMSLESFMDHYYGLGGGFVTGPHLVQNPDNPDDLDDQVWKVGAHWSEEVRNVPRNLDELRVRLRSSIMVRRLRQHVMPWLPRKQWHLLPLESTAGIRQALKHPGWDVAASLYEMDLECFNGRVPFDGQFSTAWRELSEAKAPAVADYIRQLLREGTPKLVVGAWHRSVLAYLHEELDDYGIAYMDGRTSPTKKDAEVLRFQKGAGVRIMLGQMQTLGEGWGLEVADEAVLATPHPTPGRNEQFFDRICGGGTEGGHVTCHVPMVPHTLDERMLLRAIEKDVSIHRALDQRDDLG